MTQEISTEEPNSSTSTAQRLRAVDRLAGHFHSSPRVFLDNLLEESVGLTNAIAGQIWALNEIGQLNRVGSTDPNRLHAFENPNVVNQHRQLLSQVLATGKSSTTPFKDVSQQSQIRVIHLAPLHMEEETIGVVELILDRRPANESKIGLDELISKASEYLIHRAVRLDDEQNGAGVDAETSQSQPATEAKPVVDGFERFKELDSPSQGSSPRVPPDQISVEPESDQYISAQDVEEFVLLIHSQSDFQYVSATAVNETRRLANCDRVCLATTTSNQCEVRAISGQDVVVSKSNTVRALQRLAEHTIRTGREISFEFGTESRSSEAFDLIAEYLDSSGASWLQVIPLFAPEEIDFESSVHVGNKVAFAALIVEQFSDKPAPNDQTIQRLSNHISLASYHALQHDDVFLLPLLRKIGRWSRVAKLTRFKMLIATCCVILVTCVLTFVDAPYYVQATGRLMPVQQFRAYTPIDGQVQKVWVESGQVVEPNQMLVSVHGESLTTRELILSNNIAEKKKLLSAYKAQLDQVANQDSSTDRISLSAKIAQYALEIKGLNDQLELTQKLVALSQVRSPISGAVATFRPGDLLNGRPVSRGELLLEVMNKNGPWQLELQVPEKRLGHLLVAIQNTEVAIPVSFIQATAPEHSYKASVTQLSDRVSQSENGSSSMIVHANIESDQTLRRTIGAEVTAKIHCGERSLGYVWFGDISDWLRSTFW